MTLSPLGGIEPQIGDAYARYEIAMNATLGEFGGRLVASLAVDGYESLQPWPHQPERISILEWPDTVARAAYLSSDRLPSR